MPGVHFLNLEYFFGLIYRLFFGGLSGLTLNNIFELPLWYQVLAITVCLIFLVGIGLFTSRLLNLRRAERDAIFKTEAVLGLMPEPKNEQWEKIVRDINSDNPANWKQAIIEADKILEQIVNTLNLPGDNLGEKLKQIEKSDFLTLDDAWEAHKVRNRIAHEAGFQLGQHEARRVLGLYEKVFREFDYL